MNRRRALKVLGLSLGGLGVGLYGRATLLPPRPSRRLDSVGSLAARLFEGLDPGVRERACVGYDHPLRQYHNRGARGGGVAINSRNFSWRERSLLTDLLHAGLSEEGRRRIPEQLFIDWPGVHLMNVLFCGDPRTPPYQIILSGPHLNLRLGGRSREGAAFGGPLVYGDQRGNERSGLPGNVYRYQFLTADRLFRSLDDRQRNDALLETAPVQTQIEVQGRSGAFPGVPVADLSGTSKAIAGELVDGILSSYPAGDVAYAWRCLEANGGIEALHVSYYAEGEVDGSGAYQIFRLEGPAAVFYYRGYPHVHAFLNVSMDGENPLSVGELLGENPAALGRAGVKRLFEEALRAEEGADLAYYHEESVAGRLRKGPIRSGDVYTLESWREHVEVVEVLGADLHTGLAAELRGRNEELDPARTYTIATHAYAANELGAERLGRILRSRRGALVREAVIAHLEQHGFPSTG